MAAQPGNVGRTHLGQRYVSGPFSRIGKTSLQVLNIMVHESLCGVVRGWDIWQNKQEQ